MDKTISVIVPAYNSEKYIDDCMKSLLDQNMTDYEILVVDDASTDLTGQILKRYAAENPDKVKIYSQEINKKQGAARNLALKYAKGKYVFFVDSDDIIEKNALYILYCEAEKRNADIVFCDYLMFGENIETVYCKHVQNPYLGKLTVEKKKALLTTSVVPWGKLIKKEIIEKNDIFFPENCSYEDQATTYLFYLYANMVSKVDLYLYKYRVTSSSTTNTINAKRHLQHKDMALLLIDRIQRRGLGKTYKDEIDYFLFEQMYVFGIINCLKQYDTPPDEYISSLLKTFLENCPDYKNNWYYQNFASDFYKNILEMHKSDQKSMIDKLHNGEFLGCSSYMNLLYRQKERIEQLFSFFREQGLSIGLWGAGKSVLILLELLDELNFSLDYIFDQDKKKVGTKFGKYDISSLDKVHKIDLVIVPYMSWMPSVQENIKQNSVKIKILDLEVYTKHVLNLHIKDYME